MTGLPVITPPNRLDNEVVVPGILLAAGTSTRFGAENKLLAKLHSKPIVYLAAKHLVESHTATDYAIIGYDACQVRSILSDLPIVVSDNPSYNEGQGSSVRVAMAQIDQGEADGVLFALGDMPCVKPATVNALLRTFATGNWSALAAAANGTRGNPVLFDATHFTELASVTGDTGARNILLSATDAALVETNDPGVTRDIDTQDDLTDLQSG